MKKQLAAWIVLGIITVAAGLLLAVTNEVTKKVIASQTEAAAVQARQSVLPQAELFQAVELPVGAAVSAYYVGVAGNDAVGYIAQINRKGYKGVIEVMIGIGLDNKITGISVGGANFAETAGLGAKVKEAKFTDQFIGKTAPITVIKAGGSANETTIDAVTSATISSKAVTSAVNEAAEFIKTQQHSN
jgi:Na+-translocating ferredoxin:NAD+ oxidoreductase subunit G